MILLNLGLCLQNAQYTCSMHRVNVWLVGSNIEQSNAVNYCHQQSGLISKDDPKAGHQILIRFGVFDSPAFAHSEV